MQCTDNGGCSWTCKRLKRIGQIFSQLEALASEVTQDPSSRTRRYLELLDMESDPPGGEWNVPPM